MKRVGSILLSLLLATAPVWAGSFLAGGQGAAGPAGAPGADGSQILTGDGAPDDGDGVNGDFYIDNLTGDYYLKAAGTWGAAQASLAGPPGPVGASGADGAPGVPGYSPNQVVNGCGITYTGSGLVYRVAACEYIIDSTTYTAAETEITLSAADGSNPRRDVIVATTSGTIVKVDGTAAASPVPPEVDLTTQLQLGEVTVNTSATEPTDVTTEDIYLEDAEWTTAQTGGTVTLASTSNPRTGTKDVEGTAVANGNLFSFTAPSPFALTSYNNLVFYVRSKASWGTQSFELRWYTAGGSAVGSAVTFKSGVFSFNSSVTGAYQLIIVPVALFNTGSTNVSKLQWKKKGSGTLGFHLDDVVLQGGVAAATSGSASIIWRGAWNATATYAPNDAVSYNGVPYAALVASTNVVPSNATATTWSRIGSSVRILPIVIGADNGAVLVDTDDQPSVFSNQTGYTLTIVEVWCESDAGTPTVNLQRDDGSAADILSSALTCTTSGATSTSFSGSEATIADDVDVDFKMVAAGGTAKRVSIMAVMIQ